MSQRERNERRSRGARAGVLGPAVGVCLGSFGLVFASTNVQAVTPQDYEKGRHLTVQDGSALGIYTLPLDILAAIDGNLAELAVFNADGNLVTYTVRVPEAMERSTLTQTLPLFPLYVAGPQQGRAATVEVATQSDGTLARVQVSAQSVPPTSTSRIHRYLVDASAAKGAIEELSFVIRPHASPDANFTWPVRIAAGNSLDTLSPVAYSGTLARLSHQGTNLNVEALATPGLRERYLAITWDGEAPGEIERVEARVSAKGLGAALQTTYLEAQRVPWEEAAKLGAVTEPRFALAYDARAVLPLRALQLELPEGNRVALVDVYTKAQPPSTSDPGVLVFSGAVFRLLHQGGTVAHAPFDVATTARYVTVTTSQAASVAALGLIREQGPFSRLEVTYAPTQVLFVASGAAPFTLAYGTYQPSHAVSPSELGLLGANLNAPPSARDNVVVGEPFTLGSKVRPPEPWPWKRIGLWSVLLVGLGVLAVMTRGLVRRL